jgi:hypothetical protein
MLRSSGGVRIDGRQRNRRNERTVLLLALLSGDRYLENARPSPVGRSETPASQVSPTDA